MWIVFEGLDGAGTTTQSARLTEYLRERGISVSPTAEPSGGRIGRMLREGLRSEFTLSNGERLPAEVLALLFAADRIHHAVDEVQRALDKGEWVICDRYVHSSLAYQGNELPMDWVASINRRAPDPDLVIFLDVPVTVAMQRLGGRDTQREIFEHESFLSGVRERYIEALADGEIPYQTLDGTHSEGDVFAAVLRVVEPLIGG